MRMSSASPLISLRALYHLHEIRFIVMSGPVCVSVSITGGAMSSNWIGRANPLSHHHPNSLRFWQNCRSAKEKVITSILQVRNQGYVTQTGVDWLIYGFGYKPWLTRNVWELMWG